jgi:hypothetical protein
MPRCSFVDQNGLQCRTTTEQPTLDGWADLFQWGSGVPDGWYCPKHAKAIDQLEEDGELGD